MGQQGARADVVALTLLAVVATSLPSCGEGSGNKAAAAAIVVGAAVAAAAINRAVTDECWGNCPPGTYCDEGSGLCIAPDESVAPPPEDDVEWVECDPGEFECAPNQWLRCEKRCEWVMCGPEEAATSSESPQRCCRQPCAWLDCFEDGRPCEPAAAAPRRRSAHTNAPPGAATGNPAVDPCRGLCMPGERCVVRDAVADCIVAER